jgi:hypothetical protein
MATHHLKTEEVLISESSFKFLDASQTENCVQYNQRESTIITNLNTISVLIRVIYVTWETEK